MPLTRLIVLLTIASLAGGVWANGASIKDDLFVGVWSPFRSKWETDVPVCVWSEDGNNLYQVSAGGTVTSTDFRLSNDVNDTIEYRVFWHTGRGFNRRERLQPNILSRKNYRFSDTAQCIDGPSARIRVRLNRRAVNAAPPGIYNDQLVLTISPL